MTIAETLATMEKLWEHATLLYRPGLRDGVILPLQQFLIQSGAETETPASFFQEELVTMPITRQELVESALKYSHIPDDISASVRSLLTQGDGPNRARKASVRWKEFLEKLDQP